MTRRSFCFLFGAGIAGATLASTAQPVDGWYVDVDGRLHVQQADQWTTIDESVVVKFDLTAASVKKLTRGSK